MHEFPLNTNLNIVLINFPFSPIPTWDRETWQTCLAPENL